MCDCHPAMVICIFDTKYSLLVQCFFFLRVGYLCCDRLRPVTHNFWACWILFRRTFICKKKNNNFDVKQMSPFLELYTLGLVAHLVLLSLHLLSQVKFLRLKLVDPLPHLFGSLSKTQQHTLYCVYAMPSTYGGHGLCARFILQHRVCLKCNDVN